ncbi:V-type ATP synthase subunit D [Legionella bononiensis]|nr:V-type ATP synthase subunit D [Legionella bononiensis]
MKPIKLNKAYLSMEQNNLKNYQKYLPSLELKRKKLQSERNMNQKQMNLYIQQESELQRRIETHLPMAFFNAETLKQWIHLDTIDIDQENLVGVQLPVLRSIQFKIVDYAYFNSPHWMDCLIRLVCQSIELRLHIKVMESRQILLNKSIQTVTQRKNLFEKVLIPTALKNIRLIQIFLSDHERAAVVSSKIAKKKRQLS